MAEFERRPERHQRQGTAPACRRPEAAPAPNALLAHQQAVGNQAVQRQIHTGTLPPRVIAAQQGTLGNRTVQRLLHASASPAVQRAGADVIQRAGGRKPGGAPAGADAIARQKLNEINPLSIATDWEYGGVIYRDEKGAYGATGPRTSEEKHTVDVGLYEKNKGCPEGTTPVAYYHTHGKLSDPLDGGLRFNDEELIADDVDIARAHEIDAYLATPSGKFLKYDHQTGQTTRLSGTIATRLKEDKSIPIIRGFEKRGKK